MTWRFMLVVAGVAALVLAVVLVPLGFFLVQTQHDRIVSGLERDAFVLAGRGVPSLDGDTASVSALTDLSMRYRQESGARVVIAKADGIAIVTSDDDQATVGASYLTRPEIASALRGQVVSGSRFSHSLGFELVYVAVPVYDGSRVIGAVRLTYPAHVFTDAADQQIALLVLVGLTAVALACLAGAVLSRGVTRPLRRLTELTQRVASGQPNETADDQTGAPELRTLARSFNTMSHRVADAIEQQRQFASDASHQLRTPLTGLRLRMDRARQLLPAEPTEAASRLVAAEADIDRLDELVAGLLQLSRLESESAAASPVELGEVVRARVEQWRPLAEEKGFTLTSVTPTPTIVVANRGILEHILDAYLDNAIAYSHPGSTIELRVDSDETGATVHVLDRGPGMPEQNLERAFERFWRGRDDGSGTGLGLGLVARLAALGDIAVALHNRPGGGIDASARYPNQLPAPPRSRRRAR